MMLLLFRAISLLIALKIFRNIGVLGVMANMGGGGGGGTGEHAPLIRLELRPLEARPRQHVDCGDSRKTRIPRICPSIK